MSEPTGYEQQQTNEFGFMLPEKPEARLAINFTAHEGLPEVNEYYFTHLKDVLKTAIDNQGLQLPVFAANKVSGAELAIPGHKIVGDEARFATLKNGLQESLGAAGLVESSGPFINIYFDRAEAAVAVIGQVLELGSEYGKNNSGEGSVSVLDVSSPNIAKQMHLGHLRSTVIGEALARTLRANGSVVIRDNHLGDWGTQFGMLGHAYDTWGGEIDELREESTQVTGLLKLYVKINNEIAEQKANNMETGYSELEEAGRAWFARLEQGDAEATELWQWAYQLSLAEFEQIYSILGVDFEYMLGESLYATLNQDVYRVFEERGIARLDDKNRLQLQPTSLRLPPLTIRKSDGSSLYGTRDLACLVARKEWFKPQEVVYVVGDDQTDYFRQVFDGFSQLTEDSEDVPLLEHVAFGPVELPTGKMSTRKGNVVFLADVIQEVYDRAYERVSENMTQRGIEHDEDELVSIAQAVAVGAIIYYDLKQTPGRKIVFDWEEALSFTGNTGPYLQYTNARLNALIRRHESVHKHQQSEQLDLESVKLDDSNRELVMLIGEYPEVVKQAGDKKSPTLIAEYLYRLAHGFNGYYTNNRIIDEPNEQLRIARILLVRAVKQSLQNGLEILNIPTPLRM